MIFVDSDEKIAQFETDMQESLQKANPFITVDTEFVRENAENPILCLIQIATKRETYLIDPLAVSLQFLQKYFSDNSLTKVFHSAQQDVELLALNGLNVTNIYDTQLFEMLLSTRENASYQSLVLHYLNKKLQKIHCRSEWIKRPLSNQQLQYAASDVSHLRKVFTKQRNQLEELDRLHWLDDELHHLYSKQENSLEKSVHEENIPVLRLLAERRKQTSQELNISENFVSDDLIKSICRKGAEFIRTLLNARNITDNNVREFLEYAESISDKIVIKSKQENTADVSLLKTLLLIKSEEMQICPTLIATSNDLRSFAEGNKSVKFLNGWRYEVFGKIAQQLIDGNLKLGFNNGKVEIYDK